MRCIHHDGECAQSFCPGTKERLLGRQVGADTTWTSFDEAEFTYKVMLWRFYKPRSECWCNWEVSSTSKLASLKPYMLQKSAVHKQAYFIETFKLPRWRHSLSNVATTIWNKVSVTMSRVTCHIYRMRQKIADSGKFFVIFVILMPLSDFRVLYYRLERQLAPHQKWKTLCTSLNLAMWPCIPCMYCILAFM